MPWKFVCDIRFPEVLQTTIIKQITKENEKNESIEKYSQKLLELSINLYVCMCVHVCVCVLVIVADYCVWTYKCCLVYSIQMQI